MLNYLLESDLRSSVLSFVIIEKQRLSNSIGTLFFFMTSVELYPYRTSVIFENKIIYQIKKKKNKKK